MGKIIQSKALECNSLITLDSILAYYSTLEMDCSLEGPAIPYMIAFFMIIVT